jgi:hypothetical protein
MRLRRRTDATGGAAIADGVPLLRSALHDDAESLTVVGNAAYLTGVITNRAEAPMG